MKMHLINEPSNEAGASGQGGPAGSFEGLLAELGQVARQGRFDVAPNPCVGAAVIADGVVIARGYTQPWGAAHGEIEALKAAAASGVPREKWDSLVVTLEPCSSTGKTGACTDAILESGIRHVVVGALDPDPRHGGLGLELLRSAGLEVDFIGARVDQPGSWALEKVAKHFTDWTSYERMRRPRPWVIAKWAQTLTGQLTPPENVGEGRWISGPACLDEVQVLRGKVDAILTGIGTVKADDPRLNVRAPGDVSKAPMRVIFDSYLITPTDAKLFDKSDSASAGKGRVVIFCKSGSDAGRWRALEAAGAEVVTLPSGDDGRLSLRAAMDWLWDAGVKRALLEAGPTLTEAFRDAELMDQARIYSGSINGGRGESLAPLIGALLDRDRLIGSRLDRECGGDSVLEVFV